MITDSGRIIQRWKYDFDTHRIKQLVDSSDDVVRRPSVLIESFQNPVTQLALVSDNPFLGQDEYGTRGNSESIA